MRFERSRSRGFTSYYIELWKLYLCIYIRNNNEKPNDRYGSIFKRGKFSVYFDPNNNWGFSFSWDFWANFCHAYVEFDGDETPVISSIAFPPVSFWLSLKFPTWKWKGWRYFCRNHAWPRYTYCESRKFGFSIHHGTLWWSLWENKCSWSRSDPDWQSFRINFPDLLLGRWKYSEETISEEDVEIPMPEKNYPATLKMFESTWKRPLWFPKRLVRAKVEIPEGIPHPGKGTASWNCGEDATYGLTCKAKTPEEAIAAVVESVLGCRRRYPL